MSRSSTVHYALKLQRQTCLYSMVVNGTSNIYEIATKMNIDYNSTIKSLKELIFLSSPYPKDWYAFSGAYIDQEKKQIVLAIPPDELVIFTAGIGKGTIWFLRILGYAFGLFFLLLLFLMHPINLQIAFIVTPIMEALAAFMVITTHIVAGRTKRIRKYYDLISNQKITKIDAIAQAIQKSTEFVRKDLQRLIKTNYLINARIDFENDRIAVINRQNKHIPNLTTDVFQKPISHKPLVCDNCGTKHSISLSDKGKKHMKLGFAIEKIFGVTGWFFGSICSFITIFAIIDFFKGDLDLSVVVLFMTITFFPITTIIRSLLMKKCRKRYKKYIALISSQHITSAAIISNIINQSINIVIVDLKTMIKNQYFENIQLDMETYELVIDSLCKKEVTCKHCFAPLMP